PDIGGAMAADSDDPAQAELLAQIIAATQTINGYVVIADTSGIHWHGISAAARVIKYLEDHTERGEGNFRFAAGVQQVLPRFDIEQHRYYRFRAPVFTPPEVFHHHETDSH